MKEDENQNSNSEEWNSLEKCVVPYSKINKIVKLSTDSKFSKASIAMIQSSISEFVKELAKLSEKQSRVRCKKTGKDQIVTIKKEDVLAALQKAGKKFSFINSSTEFLDDNFWAVKS